MGTICPVRFILVDGEGSERYARRLALSKHVLYEKVLEGGLKVEEARDLSELVSTRAAASGAILLIGPLDGTRSRAADALLKCFEDLPGGLGVIAWVRDPGGLPPALLSRAERHYCPGRTGPDPETESAARKVFDLVDKQPWEVLSQLEGIDPVGFCLTTAEVATSGDPVDLARFDRARKVLQIGTPTKTDLLWILFGG